MQNRAASFQKGNVESLKEKLTELIGNEEKVRGYKDQAQEYVCGRYDWDEVTSKTVDLYFCSQTRREKNYESY